MSQRNENNVDITSLRSTANGQFKKPIANPKEAKIIKEKKKPSSRLKKGIIYALALILLLIVVVIWKRLKLSKKLLNIVFGVGKAIVELPKPMDLIAILGTQIFFAFFGIPGLVIFTGIIAQAKQEIWTAFFLFLIAVLITAKLHYVIFTSCCKKMFVKKFKKKLLFKVIKEESKKRPFTISYMIRWLAIPPMYKSAVIAISEVSFWVYISSFILQVWAYSLLWCFVGSQVKNADDLFDKKPFSEQSKEERIMSLITYFAMGISALLILVIIILITRKVRHMKKVQQQKESKKTRIREDAETQKLELNSERSESKQIQETGKKRNNKLEKEDVQQKEKRGNKNQQQREKQQVSVFPSLS